MTKKRSASLTKLSTIGGLSEESFTDADVARLANAARLSIPDGEETIPVWPTWPDGAPLEKRVSKREALKARLNPLAAGYRFNKAHYAKQSSRDTRLALEKIEAASQRLLSALFDGPAPRALELMPSFPIPTRYAFPPDVVRALPAEVELYLSVCASADPQPALGADSLGEAIKGIYATKEWAAKAALQVEEEAAGRAPGVANAGDIALNRLIEGLIYDAYQRCFDRRPGFSQNYKTGQPDGPCVRFAEGVLNHLGAPPLTKAAIAGRIKEIKKRHVGKSRT